MDDRFSARRLRRSFGAPPHPLRSLNGGASRSRLVLPFLSFFVLFGTFPIFLGFSRFVRGLSEDLPDLSFSSFSAYKQHLRGTVPKGSATQSGLGEGKWGRKKCRRIPRREGDWQGRVPKRSLHPKTPQNKRFGAPNFLGISPKLFAALRGIHPYLCTPVLPRLQLDLSQRKLGNPRVWKPPGLASLNKP